MEQEIILEGIHAMLEEIRDNMKRNPEVETMKSKLNAIEKVCYEFAGREFVTEDVLTQFLACTLQKIAEMDKKQEENMRGYISEYNMYIREQLVKQQQGVNIKQGRIENLLREIRENQGLFRGFKRWIRQF